MYQHNLQPYCHTHFNTLVPATLYPSEIITRTWNWSYAYNHSDMAAEPYHGGGTFGYMILTTLRIIVASLTGLGEVIPVLQPEGNINGTCPIHPVIPLDIRGSWSVWDLPLRHLGNVKRVDFYTLQGMNFMRLTIYAIGEFDAWFPFYVPTYGLGEEVYQDFLRELYLLNQQRKK